MAIISDAMSNEQYRRCCLLICYSVSSSQYELYRKSKKNSDADETQTQAVSTADSAAAAATTENESLRHR